MLFPVLELVVLQDKVPTSHLAVADPVLLVMEMEAVAVTEAHPILVVLLLLPNADVAAGHMLLRIVLAPYLLAPLRDLSVHQGDLLLIPVVEEAVVPMGVAQAMIMTMMKGHLVRSAVKTT